ncbi:TRAP transporter small permease subunit [Microbacterium sp. A588]
MTTLEVSSDRVAWLRWIDRFSILLAVLGGTATVGLMGNVVLDVIGRFFFNRSLPGTLGLTQYAWMPMLISLGLGYALLRGEHIRVNLLTAPTGERVQRIIEVVGMVFTLGTMVLFIWFGTEKAVEAMGFGEASSVTSWLVIWPYRWVIVVGMAGLLLQAFAQLLRAITAKEFSPVDDDEVAVALEAEATVFDELGREPETVRYQPAVGGTASVTTGKVEAR